MKLLVSTLIVAAFACAQNSDKVEIRGTVVEKGIGIAGVTVTLYEFGHTPALATTRTVFATTSTDSKGVFVLHPQRPGEYYVEVKKDGYFAESYNGPTVDPDDSTGDSVSIDADHPLRERKFSLMRLGELRGRIIDENGEPMKGLRVVAHPRGSSPSAGWEGATTDAEGFFVAAKLRPGDYLVRIQPQRAALEVLSKFTQADLKIVDQDLETSEWPGGGDERSASPVPVGPGASLSVGTITVRKAVYYRAHVSVLASGCVPGEKWSFAAIQSGPESPFIPTIDVPCAKEFLVRNLKPGSYLFALTSGRNGENARWAHTPVQVTRENLELSLTMFPTAEIEGRVTTVEGVALPAVQNMRVSVTPAIEGFADFVLFSDRSISPDLRGRFLIKGLQGDRHRVVVGGPGGNYYVKEFRNNGLAAVDGVITLAPGAPAQLEIVLDDKAASVSGVVTDSDKPVGDAAIMLVKWPMPADVLSLFLVSARSATDEQGRFRVQGLTPGEYRILAMPRQAIVRLGPESMMPLLERAEKITLEGGSAKSISLKIVEP